ASRRRDTRFSRDWSSDVCSSDLAQGFHFQGKADGLLYRPARIGVYPEYRIGFFPERLYNLHVVVGSQFDFIDREVKFFHLPDHLDRNSVAQAHPPAPPPPPLRPP